MAGEGESASGQGNSPQDASGDAGGDTRQGSAQDRLANLLPARNPDAAANITSNSVDNAAVDGSPGQSDVAENGALQDGQGAVAEDGQLVETPVEEAPAQRQPLYYLDELQEDHKFILRLLKLIDAMSVRIQYGRRIPSVHLRNVLELYNSFVDQHHFGKEENILFKAMLEAGVRKDGPLAHMKREHDTSRKCMESFDALVSVYLDGSLEDLDSFRSEVAEHTAMLKEHLVQEEKNLISLGERTLSLPVRNGMGSLFLDYEFDTLGTDGRANMDVLLTGLMTTYVR